MRWRIATGGLLAALVMFLAGCDNCCRRSALQTRSPCCPPTGGPALVPGPPPPTFSGYQPAAFSNARR